MLILLRSSMHCLLPTITHKWSKFVFSLKRKKKRCFSHIFFVLRQFPFQPFLSTRTSSWPRGFGNIWRRTKWLAEEHLLKTFKFSGQHAYLDFALGSQSLLTKDQPARKPNFAQIFLIHSTSTSTLFHLNRLTFGGQKHWKLLARIDGVVRWFSCRTGHELGILYYLDERELTPARKKMAAFWRDLIFFRKENEDTLVCSFQR